MPRYKDEPPAVRVYTVCDESKYLIVRNVPSLGCGDELLKLFSSYGDVEDALRWLKKSHVKKSMNDICKPMDAEDSEPFTDVYWIKFHQVNKARFAKRKLDESVFLGNRLQVSYAPQFENLADTKEKLEGRRKEVLGRINPRREKPSEVYRLEADSEVSAAPPLTPASCISLPLQSFQSYPSKSQEKGPIVHSSSHPMVSADKEYFPSHSMNQTVQLVRDKLNKIQSSAQPSEVGSSKKPRIDNRRRI